MVKMHFPGFLITSQQQVAFLDTGIHCNKAVHDHNLRWHPRFLWLQSPTDDMSCSNMCKLPGGGGGGGGLPYEKGR